MRANGGIVLVLLVTAMLSGCGGGGGSSSTASQTVAMQAVPGSSSTATTTAASSGSTSTIVPSSPVGGGPPVWQGVSFPSSWKLWPGPVVAVPPSTTGNTYYVDGTNGNDSNAGTSPTAALQTLAAAINKVQAGDTVLIRKGLYRGGMPWITKSGSPGKPITFGSYGDGEVILDGSPALPADAWTQVSGTVWKIVNPGFTPVAVVVNGVPLHEVNSGQTAAIPAAPQPWIPAPGSGQWYYDSSANTLYADFGTVLGNSGNPNTADIIVPRNGAIDSGTFSSTIGYQANYLTFAGLTVRGGTYSGISGEGSYITVVDCQLEFNTRGGLTFVPYSSSLASVGDQALYNLAHDNVLENWPRGNNGYYSWGGWPMHFGAYACYQCLFQGNIVYHGGGEGILNYGSKTGVATGSNVVRQNIVYDNWSTEIYFDNQPNDIAEDNFVFSHPDTTVQGDLLAYWAKGAALLNAPGISLADESNSGPGTALANSTVTNNIVINSVKAINDGCDGSTACATHALINTKITNNTIVLPPDTDAYYGSQYGFYFQYNNGANTGDSVENNVVLGHGVQGDTLFWYFTWNGTSGPTLLLSGITAQNNQYFLLSGATAGFEDGSENLVTFPTWQIQSGQDGNSSFANPNLVDPTAFDASPATTPVFDPKDALPPAGSPLSVGAQWVF